MACNKDIETAIQKHIRENYIPKQKIVDMIMNRKFELQQSCEDLEDDLEIKILERILRGE